MSDPAGVRADMPLRDDNPSEVDLLGFEDVVDVVESIITRDDLDPVTGGVNAPWGGGKTTVLHLLKRRLDARADVFCLLVSPWEHDNKTDPTTALIDEVLGGLEAKLEAAKTFGDKMKEALSSRRDGCHVPVIYGCRLGSAVRPPDDTVGANRARPPASFRQAASSPVPIREGLPHDAPDHRHQATFDPFAPPRAPSTPDTGLVGSFVGSFVLAFGQVPGT